LNLNVIKKLKSVTADGIEAVTEIADLLFTIAGIDTNKLTKTPKANVNISTKANEPSNFQTKKVTPTGIAFCSAKMTVKMANPNRNQE
jgi:hypothetical protein